MGEDVVEGGYAVHKAVASDQWLVASQDETTTTSVALPTVLRGGGDSG